MKLLVSIIFFIVGINLLLSQDYIPHRSVYYIQSALTYGKSNGACWDIRGKNISFKKGQNLIVWELSDKLPDRKFRLIYIKNEGGKNWYTLSPEYANGWARVDVAGGGSGDGTNIHIWDKNDSHAQLFTFKHLGDGRFKIYNKNGKILCLDGQRSGNGTNIHLWSDHNATSTEWYLIDVSSNKTFVPQPIKKTEEPVYKNPFVRVLDAATGLPISNATVTVYDGILRPNKPYTKLTNSIGETGFEDIPTMDNQYYILVSAKGYGSKRLDGNNNWKNKIKEFKLDKIENYHPVEVNNHGIWLYEKIGDHYYYIDGEVEKNDNKYFYNHKQMSEESIQLKNAIGLDGTVATTDEEIFSQFKKVWDFWVKYRVDVMMTPKTEAHKKAKEVLLKNREGRWPGINDYAHIFANYQCLPTMNCSSIAFEFASLLSLTGIPHNKMAVEMMYSNTLTYGQHLSILLFIKNKWIWIDPGIAWASVSTLDNFDCIPKQLNNQYNTPYRIVAFPNSENMKVPKCEYLKE